MALHRGILKQLALHPKRVAMVDDQREWTGVTTLAVMYHLAAEIGKQSDRPRVGVMLPTSGAFGAALLGVWQAGRVPVPLNYLLKAEDLRHVVEDAELDLVLTVGKMLDFAPDGWMPEGVKLVKLEDMNFKALPPVRWPAEPKNEDLGLLLYTSGTSGKPKGVMLTHANLEANVRQAVEHAGLTQTTGFLGVLPQFHTFGITVLTLLPMRMGSKVVYTARFNPKRIFELLREHRPQVFVAIPTMYAALMHAKDARDDDWQSVDLLVAGGEKLSQKMADKFEERFGKRILEGYGLTETSPCTHWNTPDKPRPGSVGRALPDVETQILDDHGNPLPQGEEGEIALGGPNLMKGYFKLDDLTSDTITEVDVDSRHVRVMKTGDIGKIDDEGFLWITGRSKELLIIGGENVAPMEIEEVLDQHEAVKASAVIGRPCDKRGEMPIAFVELHDGKEADPAEIRSFAQKQLPSAKVPKEVIILDALPRNPTGKIVRRALGEFRSE